MAKNKRSQGNVPRLVRNGGTSAIPAVGPHFDGTLACACRHLEGGIAAFVNFARAAQSNDPTLAQFLEAWDGLEAQAQQDPSQADALCRRLRLSPLEVLRAVVQAAVEFCTLTSGLMACLALPEMVEKTIQFASMQKGFRDRELLYRTTGMVDTPGGISIVNQVAARAQAKNIQAGGQMFVPFEQDVLEVDEEAEKDSTKRDPEV